MVHANVRDNIIRLGANYRFGGTNASIPPTQPAATIDYNWTGFYVGANVGYGLGRNKGNEVLSVPPVFPVDTAQSFTHTPNGIPVGAQAGYNWQTGNWVAGTEGDWQWTNQRDSISITNGTPSSNLNRLGLTLDQTTQWLATLRGRLGYDRSGWLWYLTAGGAAGSVKENDALTIAFPMTTTAQFNHTLAGWTIGAGVEKTITGSWTAKFEYLYVNLGAATDSFAVGPGAIETVHQNFADHIVRLGLNYRL